VIAARREEREQIPSIGYNDFAEKTRGKIMMGVIYALKILVGALLRFLRGLLILALVILAVLLNLLAEMWNFLAAVFGVIAKMLVIAGLVSSTFYAAAMTFAAYGADLPALLPAALLIVAMTALGLSKLSWGALLAGGLTALAIGTVIQSADIVTRSLIIVCALATTVAHNQMNTQRSESHENQEEQQYLHHPDQDRTDLLYDAADCRSGDVHPSGEHQDLRRRGYLRPGYSPARVGQLRRRSL